MNQPSPDAAIEQDTLLGYRNASLPIGDRVSDLLRRMTIEEKVAQMLCLWQSPKGSLLDETGNVNLDYLRENFRHGLGQIARPGDRANGLTAHQTAELTNALQRFFVNQTRLGIPVMFHEECLHGLVGREATSYPQPIGLASTFDPELVEEIYSAVAEDARSRGIHQALTPVLDVAREPRWGRVEETFGEDPYLVAQMGIAAVRGFQGDGRFEDKKRVVATLKHFAAHGQPESGTNCAPANVSERTLRDTFLYPFRETLQKAGALSVMASYNEIDGVPSHANAWLLRDVLRGEWGFKGFVVSDYYGITELHQRPEATSHSVARDKREAGLLAAKAGVNCELPDADCYPYLVELVRSGELDECLIDELVRPLLDCKFRIGLFENPYVDVGERQSEARLEREREIAFRAALKTITLLKNDGQILPITLKKGGTLGVIGPNAQRRLLGGYSGKPKYYTSVLEGIREKVKGRMDIVYAEGCKITIEGSWEEDRVVFPDPESERQSIREAVEVAKRSDTVIMVLGGNEQTSREAWSRSHLGDRASLELPGAQNDLARAIVETGKPVIVLLFNGRPNSINYLREHAAAILECWYLGQEAGRAVADVLFGDYNPGGKLPISIPRSAGHLPCHYNYKPSARRGYVDDAVDVPYPFGFGLSYTTFRFGAVRLEKNTIRTNESTSVSVEVTNIGGRAGEEVVQLYIRDVVSTVTRPVKELRGFKRVRIEPGETRTVTFQILPEHLSFTNIDKQLVVEPGTFEVMVGNSSRDEDLTKVVLEVIPGE